MVKRIYFATTNMNKIREAKAILKEFEIIQVNIDLPELQGEPDEIIKEKASFAVSKLGKAVFVEDTCLCFEALNGLPGQYVKHFIEKIGRRGLVKLISSYDNKSAEAMAIVGYCEPGTDPIIFKGVVKGTIVMPKGESGFGWDPIFIPEGHTKTFAEMSTDEKNKISHRKIALEKLRNYLLTL